jgi:FtsP/CotA-like multicopper oxidase with cupredoxin domain
MDGATPLTQAAVEPGKTFDYRFVATDSGTFWYHPPEPSGPGLYGMVIVDEPEPLDVDRDAAIILADGPAEAGEIIVNGARAFQIPVQSNERIRLRLLNAASTRPFSVRIDGHRAFVMAVDGQPAEPFAARDARAVLGPGNRVDLFVDCTMATGATAPVLVDSAAGAVAVAHLVYSGEGGRPSVRAEPKPLPANPLPERMDFNRALRTELSFAEAAPSALPSRPLFSAKRGRTVVVNIVNRATAVQVTHVHGHAFRLLDRLDDGWKPFWLDTIAIPPQSNDRIAFVADNPGKWLIRTRVQQSSSLAWFEVA